jgi:carboxypeptidase Q
VHGALRVLCSLCDPLREPSDLDAILMTLLRSTVLVLLSGGSLHAQDAVLERIWSEGMERSALERMAHSLLDSVGPRLTGTPEKAAGHGWAVQTLRGWGVEARNERYGSWTGWRRGTAHADLVWPRVRTLDARLVGYSRGTEGTVTGEVVALPEVADTAAFRAWLTGVAGRFVLVSPPPPSCRPVESWHAWALPSTLADLARRAAQVDSSWARRMAATGVAPWALPRVLARAGAAGVIENEWTGGWGTETVHMTYVPDLPVLNVGCEDYGLLARLAEGGGATLRLRADAALTGEAPAMNTLGFVRGSELPEEYVFLSAHFDSWDAASGATDNGSGVLVMMEAMRILREVYPRPRRTLAIGLWGGEEQGLNGSRAFAEDHPEVVARLQVLLNQDTGTGRIDRISLQGFTEAGAPLRRWLARVPAELSGGIELDDPGMPSAGSSDHSSFVCRGVPALWLLSRSWDYGTYTWHTQRDTHDKLVFPELRRNAVLLAMLAYLASEDPERVPRTMRAIPGPAPGVEGEWPRCGAALREAR